MGDRVARREKPSMRAREEETLDIWRDVLDGRDDSHIDDRHETLQHAAWSM